MRYDTEIFYPQTEHFGKRGKELCLVELGSNREVDRELESGHTSHCA
jgi:hypothetical protein